ncbi:MAG: hypothetical protein CM1200mP30_27970 [Pseudomonadota bacterium]|nr:MAG: hypothetical protein CM1200mP30_27970 [Pseudomonadota bacterium]
MIQKGKGLLSADDVEKEVQQLKRIDVDSYIQRVVNPSESKKRPSAPEIIQQLGSKIIAEETDGPLYTAEIEIMISDQTRRLGFIAQNHKNQKVSGIQPITLKLLSKYVFFHLTVFLLGFIYGYTWSSCRCRSKSGESVSQHFIFDQRDGKFSAACYRDCFRRRIQRWSNSPLLQPIYFFL